MNVFRRVSISLLCLLVYNFVNITNGKMEATTQQDQSEEISFNLPTTTVTTPTRMKSVNDGSSRKFVKLTMRQGLIMNQIIATYALDKPRSELCRNHTEEFKGGLRAFEPWALKMFDSSSKIQSSILMGNLVEYGAFRQCLNIYKNIGDQVIRGKHCTLRITPDAKLLKTVLSYKNVSDKRFEKVKVSVLEGVRMIWSVCVPDSCPASDVLTHFNKSIMELTEGLNVGVSLKEENCETIFTTPEFTTKEYIFLGLFGGWLGVIVICTALHAIKISWQFVDIFSLISNWNRLISKNPNADLNCLDGIRFLSVCYVMFGHRFMAGMLSPSLNSLDLLDWIIKYTSSAILGGTVAVDTFYVIGGMLVSYRFFINTEKTQKFNLFGFLVYRYIRITPSLAIAVIVYSSFIQHFGSGPLWRETYTYMQKPCQYFWWSALLHFQSYINPHALCIPATWYLTCYMVYYYFSPVILYPLWKWPLLGYINLGLIYISTTVINFSLIWTYKFPPGLPLTNQVLNSEYYMKYYIQPHVRAGPYIIGLAFGYLLYKTRTIPIKMNFLILLTGWIFAVISMFSVVFIPHFFHLENWKYNRLQVSLFESLHCSIWSLGLVWIIWCCCKGYGGILNQMLSCHAFHVLSKAGYGIYLFHMCFQTLRDGAAKIQGYFSDFNMLYYCCGDFMVMLIFGILFTLCFEFPCIQITSILKNNRNMWDACNSLVYNARQCRMRFASLIQTAATCAPIYSETYYAPSNKN